MNKVTQLSVVEETVAEGENKMEKKTVRKEVIEAEVVEETGGNEMENKNQYLVVKNKVENNKLIWVYEGTKTTSDNPKATPCFVMDKTIWQIQMAGVQDLYAGKIMDQKQVAEILPFVVDNVESSYVSILLKKNTS